MSEELKDDRISMEEAGNRIKDLMEKFENDKYGYVPSEIQYPPGVHPIPAFDANYFLPGTMVATYLVNDKGATYGERLALICDYEDGLQTMKLNEPWPSNECRPYVISLDDYLSGRVLIKRLVKEDEVND